MYGSRVIEQRCIFHKLRNVSQDYRGTRKSDDYAALREQARAIYDASTADAARTRLLAFAQAWEATQSAAVATMGRDFEDTIASYRIEDPAVRALARTTSLLERTNRELRRKFRQVGSFANGTSVRCAVYLQVQRLQGPMGAPLLACPGRPPLPHGPSCSQSGASEDPSALPLGK